MKRQYLFVISFIFISINLQSQCSLSCFNSVNVSLDIDCTVTITPDLLLDEPAASCPDGIFTINLFDDIGDPIPSSPQLDASYIGMNIQATIIDANSQNSCFSSIMVFDNLSPIITCGSDVEINCLDLSAPPLPIFFDCDPNASLMLINESIIDSPCDPDYVSTIFREYIAQDSYGNQSQSCTQTIFIRRVDSNSITFPPNATVECDEDISPNNVGFPIVPEGDLLPGSYCDIIVYFTDVELPGNSCLIKTIRTWTIEQLLCGNTTAIQFDQVIDQIDSTPPQAICNDGISVNLFNGIAVINPSDIDAGSYDNCGGPISLSLAQSTFDCNSIGLIENVLFVQDECGNMSLCEFDMMVQDNNGDCIPSMLIITGPLNGNQSFCSSDFIESDANIQADADIEFFAPDYIELNEGFTVDASSDFTAEIADCNNN